MINSALPLEADGTVRLYTPQCGSNLGHNVHMLMGIDGEGLPRHARRVPYVAGNSGHRLPWLSPGSVYLVEHDGTGCPCDERTSMWFLVILQAIDGIVEIGFTRDALEAFDCAGRMLAQADWAAEFNLVRFTITDTPSPQ